MCCDILFVKNASNPSQESNAPSQDVYRQQQCSMLVGKSISSMDEYTFIRSSVLPLFGHVMQSSRKFSKGMKL